MHLKVHVRWMIRRDMQTVLAIEQASFPTPWEEEDFLRVLRHRNCIGMVAEWGDQILGYCMYELHNTSLEILNLAVCPQHRWQGIGSTMVAKLIDKLSSHRRTRVTAKVRESNLPTQLFFKALGFRAAQVVRGAFDDTDEDAYLFRFTVQEPACESLET